MIGHMLVSFADNTKQKVVMISLHRPTLWPGRFQMMVRWSARKVVQKPEQVESLFSGILMVAESVRDAAPTVSSVRGFCVPDTQNHEADVVSIVVAGVNLKFV